MERYPDFTREQPARASDVRRSHHDVVVVGARCAGAPTAMLLARAGFDVVVVDRSHPARDTSSTHSLVRGGVVQLSRWGLLDEVVASGAPPIRSVRFHDGDDAVRRQVKDRAGVDHLVAPRRYVLDDLLARAAVASGARLLSDTCVTDVLRDAEGRVAGVRTRGADGATGELTARLVVGADGLRSPVAGHVGAEVVERHAPTGSCFYTYVGHVPWDGIELHVGERTFAGVFPTHGDEACVWLIRPAADLQPVVGAGADRLTAWQAALEDTVPTLARTVRGGVVTAPLRGYVGLPNQVRRAAGPGWALVGDAVQHRDPITGHGMTDAFRDAELVAEAATAVLRGTLPEAEAMARYERLRRSLGEEVFTLTRSLGAFPPKPEFLALQARLSRALEAEALALAARPATATDVADPTGVVGVA